MVGRSLSLLIFSSLFVLLPSYTSPKCTLLTLRLTLYPSACPMQEKIRSLPPTVLTLYYTHEVRPTTVGTNLTVILKEAPGGTMPEYSSTEKARSFPSSLTFSRLN